MKYSGSVDKDSNSQYIGREINCGVENGRRGVIESLKLMRDGNNVKYKFRCAYPHEHSDTVHTNDGSCQDTRDKQLAYLDRHHPTCGNTKHAISRFGMSQGSACSGNDYRYYVRCREVNPEIE